MTMKDQQTSWLNTAHVAMCENKELRMGDVTSAVASVFRRWGCHSRMQLPQRRQAKTVRARAACCLPAFEQQKQQQRQWSRQRQPQG